MKKFKSGDLVEKIEPNVDGTHDIEMVAYASVICNIPVVAIITGKWYNELNIIYKYRLINPKEVNFKL